MVSVNYNAEQASYEELEGVPVTTARLLLRAPHGIPDHAECRVNGIWVGGDYRLCRGDDLEFVVLWGRKGGVESELYSDRKMIAESPAEQTTIMRRRQKFEPDSNGDFVREIGWKLNRAGTKLVQHKFRLGKVRGPAELALRRLEHLWEIIEGHENGNGSKATWEELTLEIAKAVAKGATEFTVPRGGVNAGLDSRAYCIFVRHIKNLFSPVIAIRPEGEGVIEEFYRFLEECQESAEQAARNGRLLSQIQMGTEGPSLHQALDAYADWIKEDYIETTDDGEQLSDWGVAQLANIRRLKEHHQDIPLKLLGYNALEEMFRHWRQRPMVKGRNKKMSKDSAEAHVYQLKHFVKWLHSSEDFAWRKPEDYDAIKTRVDGNKDEKARRLTTAQVEVYGLDELRLLSEYARPIERVFLFLGLNCGFNRKELGTLRLNEVLLYQRHLHDGILGFESSDADSFIQRVRGKTGVYGEWLLWPQTVEALEWAIKRRMSMTRITKGKDAGKDIRAKPSSVILLDRHGHSLVTRTTKGNTNQRIPARWNALTDRIRKDHPRFRRLSFGKLRKTGANLVRRFAGGEIARVFLAHGQPVATDNLLEIYCNRPFGQVFDALRRVGEYLQPMFDVAPSDPFSEAAVSRSLNISLGKVKQIKQLRAEGVGPTEIARRLGVSRTTVYYHTQG